MISLSLRVVYQVIEPLPYNLHSYIIGPKGFLQWCTVCEDGKIFTLGSPCKNGCGELLCDKHKKFYICKEWETCDKMIKSSPYDKLLFFIEWYKINYNDNVIEISREDIIHANKFNMSLSSHT